MADKIPVQAMDPAKNNSPLAGPVEDEATVILNSASSVCYWNDREFSEGEVIDAEGVSYECSFGQWVKSS
jgi:hypothetical protein